VGGGGGIREEELGEPRGDGGSGAGDGEGALVEPDAGVCEDGGIPDERGEEPVCEEGVCGEGGGEGVAEGRQREAAVRSGESWEG
jgi:hypothetical protein